MRRNYLLIGILALACGGHFVSASNLNFKVDETSNLEYQLDCLSGVIRCTELNMTFVLDSADDPWLSSWRALRHQTIDAINQAHPKNTSTQRLPTAGDLVHVPSRYQSRDADRSEQTHHSKRQVLAHFKQRFANTWTDNDASHLTRLKLALAHLSNSPVIKASMDDAAALFDLRSRQLPSITLIATRLASGGSLATIGLEEIFVETPLNERANNRLPVVAHEAVHWWQSQMSYEQQSILVDAFMNSESGCVLPAYHLFDEALASAIGNGLIERALTTPSQFERYAALPLSFYADDAVDSIAKALLPLVEQYANERKLMDRAFVEQYLAIAEATLKLGCGLLASEMRSVAFLFADESLSPLAAIAQRKWQTQLAFSDVQDDNRGNTLERYAGLSAVIVATYADLERFPDAMTKEINEASRSTTGRFVFAEAVGPHTSRYWVIADTLAGAAGTFLQLLALQKNQFNGIWVPPALPSTKQRTAPE